MKYFYTYKITCTEGSLKGKIYFGKHETTYIKDGYKGSGKLLKDYYKKYPKGYIKEIICFYSNSEELNNAEKELIKPHLGKDYCLNIASGGDGCSIGNIPWNKGITGYKLRKKTLKERKAISDAIKAKSNDPEYCKNKQNGLKGRKYSDEAKKHLSEIHKGLQSGEKHPMYGKHHSDESKKKMSYAHKGKTSSIKGKHKVWDDETHSKFHYE